MIRCALPSGRSHKAGSPRSSVIWRTPTPERPSRRASSPSLGSTTLRPWASDEVGGRAQLVGIGQPVPAGSGGVETSGDPKFLGSPVATCPALRPRRVRSAGLLAGRVLPSAPITASAPTVDHFGAQSHGLQPRCLRFAAKIALGPRKTRFRWGPALPDGFRPAGLQRRFECPFVSQLMSGHVIPPPSFLAHNWRIR